MPALTKKPSPAHRLGVLLLAALCLLSGVPAFAAKQAPLSPFAAWRARLLAPDDFTGLFALEELDARLGEEHSLTPVIAALTQAGELKGAHLERRLRSLYALRRLYRNNGEAEKAAELVRRLGFITRWQLSGPYANDGDFGMREELAPERGYFPAARLSETDDSPAWRPYPALGRLSGYTDLRAVFSPGGKALAYAFARIASPKTQKALLCFGAFGPSRVWLNGQLLVSFGDARQANPLQEAIPVTLQAGPNTLLVKSANSRRGMGFYAALLNEQGLPLGDLSGLDEATAAAAPWPKEPLPFSHKTEAPGPALPLLLEKALARYDRTSSAANAAAVAHLHRFRQNAPYEENLPYEWALQAAKTKDADGAAWLLAARYAKERNAKLQAADAAGALLPDDYRPLLVKARAYAEADLLTSALELCELAKAKPDGEWPALRLRSELLARLDVPGVALAELKRYEAQHPATPSLLLRQAALEDQLGLSEAAGARHRALLLARPGRLGSLRWLVNAALSRRDYAEATALLQRLAPYTKGQSGEARRLALLLSGQGRYALASEVYASAVELSPNDSSLIAEWAEIEHALGRDARALELFSRAQKAAPQDLDLARRVAAFADPAPDFAASYFLAGEELQKAVLKGEQTTSREVYELAAFRVGPQGLLSRAEQRVVAVADEETLRSWRLLIIPYDPDTQSLRLLHTRIHKPDGRVLLMREESETEVAPSYGQYFSGHERRVLLPGLAKGDWLDIAWRLDDIHPDALSGHVALLRFTQGALPKTSQRLLLETRPALTLKLRAPRLAVEQSPTTNAQGYVVREWRSAQVPALVLEPNAPPLGERSDFLHVTSFASVAALGDWYARLIAPGQKPGGELTALARSLAAAGASDGERLRALFAFVKEKVRYVGLEFGVHGYVPYPADDVLARRFGDCKDKAMLFIAMARVLGLEAQLVLLRQPELGRLETGLASLLPFNHALVYLPREKRYVDPTDTYGEFDSLPERDQGGLALVLDPKGAYETRLPVLPPTADVYEQKTRWRFASEPGTLVATSELSVKGPSAAAWRERFADREKREALLALALNHDWPGLRLREARFRSEGQDGGPFVLGFTALLPGFAQPVADGLALRPTLDRPDLVERFCATSTRRTPLRFASSFTLIYESAFELGAHRPLAWPAPLELAEGPLRFTRELVQSADATILRLSLTIAAGEVEAADYPAFAKVCQSAAAAFGERLEVTP